MSGQLHVTFASDMPDASVEVIAPDLEVVDRFRLSAGRSRSVHVPSEGSFLRIYLPSGKIVNLYDPGSLTREISLDTILAGGVPGSGRAVSKGVSPGLTELPVESEPSDKPTKQELFLYHVARTKAAPTSSHSGTALPLASHGTAWLLRPDGVELTGQSSSGGREAHWEVTGQPTDPPYHLRIEHPWGSVLDVHLPANVESVWARADEMQEPKAIALSIRIKTRSEAADTIAGYLSRGDLYSAESMAEWTEEAVDMVHAKISDPYAAAMGAYLLLRLGRPERTHDWGKNLADLFPSIADGCVVWASQLMQRPTPDVGEIRRYLLEATNRGLPTFTEGLRLLTDGLRLIGADGRKALDKVKMASGVVLWDSPVTASIQAHGTGGTPTSMPRIQYDIAFAARA